MDEVDVQGEDLIRVILQFCRENGLHATFDALQEESQVSLNAVDSADTLARDIEAGRWDAVMQIISTLTLSRALLADLYEQLVLELVEMRETDAARQILRTAEPMTWMQAQRAERFARLERLASAPYYDAREAYPEGTSREGRRAALAQQICASVCEPPPSRLVALVGQALKWQRFMGSLGAGGAHDLLSDAPPRRVREEEAPPTRMLREVGFGKKSHPEAAAFSPDGLYLVTGSVDGFVEVRDADSGKLSKALAYQADDNLMMHDDAVLALGFSRDGELLVTGCQAGTIKVWRVSTGQCLRRFPKAHEQGITCVALSRDGAQLLSGSFDSLVRLHGMRSGKQLRECRGHSSYVNDVLFSADGGRLASASSDGSVRVWDAKTAECTRSFKPPQATQTHDAAISTIALWPTNPEQLLVCTKAENVHLMTFGGELVRTFESKASVDFVHCTVSPRGEWLYCAGEDAKLHAVSVASGRAEHSLKAGDKELIGVAHHPHRNVIATWGFDGKLRLWVP